MAKLTLNDVSNITGNPTSAATTLNNNAALIETALENTLSRDGTTPNIMGADLDMNGHQILNLPAAVDDTDPIRLGELDGLIDGITQGPQGPTGPAGADGAGVPVGGTVNQILTKASATDFDTQWVDPASVTVLDKDRFSAPAAANFATLTGTNSVDPTMVDVANVGTVFRFGDSPAAGDNVRIGMKAIPVSTDYSIIVRANWLNLASAFAANYPIAFSDGTKILGFGMGNPSSGALGNNIYVQEWTNNITASTSLVAKALVMGPPPEWFKVDVVSSVPTNFYISRDGTEWIKVYATGVSAFITPTHLGVAAAVNGSTGLIAGEDAANIVLLYWSDPDITP